MAIERGLYAKADRSAREGQGVDFVFLILIKRFILRL